MFVVAMSVHQSAVMCKMNVSLRRPYLAFEMQVNSHLSFLFLKTFHCQQLSILNYLINKLTAYP